MTLRSRALLVIGAVGCGSPQSPGEVEVEAAAPAAPAANPEQLEAFAPVLRAVGARKLYIERFASLLLFEDERLEAQKIIARWATALGFSVVSPEQTEAVLAAAAAGKNPETGKVCGPPLTRRMAAARWLSGRASEGHILARVSCSPDCMLQLELHLDGMGTEFFAAPFDTGKPWRDELARRLGEVVDNGGHNRHGHLNNPVEIAGVKRASPQGDWLADDSDEFPAPSLEGAAKQCGLDLYYASLLVSGDRCERFEDPGLITDQSPAVNACLCKSLPRPAGEARRIARIKPIRELEPRKTTKNGKGIRAWITAEGEYSQEPWSRRWLIPACDRTMECYNLGECFVDRTEALEPVDINTTIEFDGSSAASKVVFADLSGVLSQAERDCVTARLMAARVPCAGGATQVRTTRLRLAISEPATTP